MNLFLVAFWEDYLFQPHHFGTKSKLSSNSCVERGPVTLGGFSLIYAARCGSFWRHNRSDNRDKPQQTGRKLKIFVCSFWHLWVGLARGAPTLQSRGWGFYLLEPRESERRCYERHLTPQNRPQEAFFHRFDLSFEGRMGRVALK